MVKAWSSGTGANTWTMPLSQAGALTPGVNYTVSVEARSTPGATPVTRALNLNVVVPALATSLTLVPNLPSPRLPGTSVQFAATGDGPGTTTASKQYRFSRSADNGATWTVVLNWGAGTAVTTTPATTDSRRTWTWNIPTTQAIGTYLVRAEVRTNAGSVDVTTIIPFQVRPAPAGLVTIIANKASPGPAPVSFLATANGLTAELLPVLDLDRRRHDVDDRSAGPDGHRCLLDEPHVHVAREHSGCHVPGPSRGDDRWRGARGA